VRRPQVGDATALTRRTKVAEGRRAVVHARFIRELSEAHAARVSASQAILDRAYGKAPTFSTTEAGTFKRAIDTDDELAAIVAKARLTIVK
jgi:hypothetical protein